MTNQFGVACHLIFDSSIGESWWLDIVEGYTSTNEGQTVYEYRI